MFGFRMLSRLTYIATTTAIFQSKEGRRAAKVAVALDTSKLEQDEASSISTSTNSSSSSSSSMGSPSMIANGNGNGNSNCSCSPRMDKQKKKKKKKERKLKPKFKLSNIPLERLDSTLSLLEEYGLSAPQMCAALMHNLALFYLQPQTNVRPKLEQLTSIVGCGCCDGVGSGSGRRRVARVVASNPRVLSGPVEGKRLSALLGALRGVGGFDEQAVAQLMWRNPRALSASPERVGEGVAAVKEVLGLQPGTAPFQRALAAAVCSMGSAKLRSAPALLLDLGFNHEQARLLLRRALNVMYLRPDTIRHRVQLARERGWPICAIVSYPAIVTCSLQRRLLPRSRVIDALRARQLLRERRGGSGSYGCFHFGCLSLSDHQFCRRYIDPFVDRFPELPHIYSLTDASSSSSS